MSSSVYTTRQFEENYPDGVQDHYWNRARNRIVCRLVENIDAEPILDVGAGRGVVLSHLRGEGLECWGCELGPATPITPQIAPYLFTHQDVFDLHEDFRDSIRTLLLLDVLEHLSDPNAFLSRCLLAFPQARQIVVTVPARTELWTNHDEYFGHWRRYDAATLRHLLRSADLTELELRYFFHALYLPIRFVAAAGFRRRAIVRTPKRWWERMFHTVVGVLLAMEVRFLPGWLPGSSLITVAKVRPRTQRSR